MNFTVVIPARFSSTRLPGKPLLDIAGKPLIQHVYEKAIQSEATRVIIATDDARIESAAKQFGAEVCITSAHHRSGTERIAEVVQSQRIDTKEIVVNIQGDEPLLPAKLVSQVAGHLHDNTNAKMATLCDRITQDDELFNPNIVKVVRDFDNFALYFSRAPIPWNRDGYPNSLDPISIHKAELELDSVAYYRHIGLYAYTAGFISQYVNHAMSTLEKLESLEQLRALENGYKIFVGEASEHPGIGVDTEEDLEAVRSILATNS